MEERVWKTVVRGNLCRKIKHGKSCLRVGADAIDRPGETAIPLGVLPNSHPHNHVGKICRQFRVLVRVNSKEAVDVNRLSSDFARHD